MGDNFNGTSSYSYDVRNELTSLTQSGTGVAPKRVDFAYDTAGRRTSLTRYSDLAGTQTVLVTAYSYDAADRLTGLTHETALTGGTVVAAYGYTLDAANRLTQESRTWNSGASTDTLSYTYTNDNQLTGVTHTNASFANESFSYDATGNRTMTGYSTQTGNRLASDGTFNYQYDDEGNLISKTEIATGNQTLYTWDDRNRLVEVDQVVSGVRSVVAQFTYDALDRLIKVVEGGATRWTAYDGLAPILDFNGSGAVTARYLQGPVIDEVLARETSGGAVAWYLPDRLGTIRDLADNTGAIIDHVDYNVFGGAVGETAPASGDRFKFAGMRQDAATTLYYDNARWYDPSGARFIGQDPIRLAAGDPDLYRYAANDPSNLKDPSGLQGQDSGQTPVRPTIGPLYPFGVWNVVAIYDGRDSGGKRDGKPIASGPNFAEAANDYSNCVNFVNWSTTMLALEDIVSKDRRIEVLYLFDHDEIDESGSPVQLMGSSPITPAMAARLKPLLAPGASIVLAGCNIGLNPTYANQIANATGANVYARRGRVFYGRNPFGDDFSVERPWYWFSPKFPGPGRPVGYDLDFLWYHPPTIGEGFLYR